LPPSPIAQPSPLQFEDRDPHDLKGIADPVHLFAVKLPPL
jgi:hypothetical protein